VVQQLYDQAVSGMISTPYPPNRKLYCYLRSFWHLESMEYAKAGPGKAMGMEGWKKLCGLLDEVTKSWPDFIKENPPDQDLSELSKLVIDGINASPATRKMLFDRIYPPMEKLRPGNSTVLTIKGHFYVQYAWDGRGSGYADTVTAEGFKQMKERLAIAEEALTQAWEKDKTNAAPAIEMLSVELGQGKGRDRMELWYRRAMEADPDSRAACDAKMYYLQPKWYGSVEDMLAFAHECYETQNWEAELPFVQIQVFTDLLPYLTDEPGFFAQPQIWASIQSIYEPWLRYKSENPFARSRYCYFACHCGHWDVARKQFDILGDSALAAQFGGPEAMKTLREAAYKKALSPSVP
jgi:hypothetical protein